MIRRFFLLAVLVLALAVPSTAHGLPANVGFSGPPRLSATVVPMKVIYPRSVKWSVALKIIRGSTALVAEGLGVTLTVVSFRQQRVKKMPIAEQFDGVGFYGKALSTDGTAARFLLSPPAIGTLGQPVNSGQAPICFDRGYHSVLAFPSARGSRWGVWTASVYGTAHELGHMLGAVHRPGEASIMNPDPAMTGYLNGWVLGFSEASAGDVADCLGRREK